MLELFIVIASLNRQTTAAFVRQASLFRFPAPSAIVVSSLDMLRVCTYEEQYMEKSKMEIVSK